MNDSVLISLSIPYECEIGPLFRSICHCIWDVRYYSGRTAEIENRYYIYTNRIILYVGIYFDKVKIMDLPQRNGKLLCD